MHLKPVKRIFLQVSSVVKKRHTMVVQRTYRKRAFARSFGR